MSEGDGIWTLLNDITVITSAPYSISLQEQPCWIPKCQFCMRVSHGIPSLFRQLHDTETQSSGQMAFKLNFLAAAERMCFPAAELLSWDLSGSRWFRKKDSHEEATIDIDNIWFNSLIIAWYKKMQSALWRASSSSKIIRLSAAKWLKLWQCQRKQSFHLKSNQKKKDGRGGGPVTL